MRPAPRRIVGVIAILAIGLHVALWGVAAGQALPAPFDPFSIICHSGAATDNSASSAPAEPAGAPVHAHPCDHCNLCSSTTTAREPASAAIAQLLPAHILEVLVPPPVRAVNGITAKSASARGPPVFA